jgi:undecaprenyl-diphosphatase
MDFAIVKFFNQLGLGIIDPITIGISRGIYVIIFLTAFVFLFFDKKNGKKVFVGILIAIVLHFMFTEGFLKNVMDKIWGFRLRPHLAHPNEIVQLGTENIGVSFPSGHMSGTLAFLTVVIFYCRRYWFWALGFAMLMAFSGMHNGMHYPTDVLAGSIFGIFYGILAILITRHIRIKK